MDAPRQASASAGSSRQQAERRCLPHRGLPQQVRWPCPPRTGCTRRQPRVDLHASRAVTSTRAPSWYVVLSPCVGVATPAFPSLSWPSCRTARPSPFTSAFWYPFFSQASYASCLSLYFWHAWTPCAVRSHHRPARTSRVSAAIQRSRTRGHFCTPAFFVQPRENGLMAHWPQGSTCATHVGLSFSDARVFEVYGLAERARWCRSR